MSKEERTLTFEEFYFMKLEERFKRFEELSAECKRWVKINIYNFPEDEDIDILLEKYGTIEKLIEISFKDGDYTELAQSDWGGILPKRELRL